MTRQALLALVLLGAVGAPAAAASPEIEPRADELMHRMSNYLSALPSFRVSTALADESVTTDGQKLQFLSESRLSVRRPDKMRVERTGPLADVVLRYDGKELSVYGKKTGYYATSAAPDELDTMIDFARERFGIDAPGADLLGSNVYGALMQDVRSGRYIGLEPVDGAPCHHLAFQGENTDWQIWIQDGKRPLPVRYVITSKDVHAQPEFTATLKSWETEAALPDEMFRFTVPPGAQKIQLMPRGESPPSPPSQQAPK